ncbi:hypothetical protein K449DRAFT_244855 [Hypoxylon sp. EC38]|nr:hypothetical protein K449DRAFT_244855 [Hypoxylon sp. EC38]
MKENVYRFGKSSGLARDSSPISVGYPFECYGFSAGKSQNVRQITAPISVYSDMDSLVEASRCTRVNMKNKNIPE